MTSFAIIVQSGQKVNPQYKKTAATAKNVQKALISANPVVAPSTTMVASSRCETFNPDPHATNSWTASRMSFEWHGDGVASFDDQIHTLVEQDTTTKKAAFSLVDQPATRVIMCADLLESIIARTTYDLRTHNGEISFVNGKVHTFRAYTNDDGERVMQEKRGKKKWKLFGTISPDGKVTPIIPSHLPQLAADDDPRYADEAKSARRKIKIIQAKANLINDPLKVQSDGVAVSFKGSCRSCNRTLTNPQSVANGIGPTCAKKESQAAVAQPTVHAVHYDRQEPAASPVRRSISTSHTAPIANQLTSQLQDFDLDSDQALPLTACEILFCTSQLGAMGCSHAEIEQFFDDLFPGAPYWYPNFVSLAAEHDKSPAFLFDLCDAFVSSITPIDEYVRIAGQLFRYQRFPSGYEFVSLMGSRGGEIVELAAYPHEVQQVKQELVWAG